MYLPNYGLILEKKISLFRVILKIACAVSMGRDWRYGDRLVPEEVCVAVIVARGRCLLSPVNVARGKKIPQRQDGISQDRPILSRQQWLIVRKRN